MNTKLTLKLNNNSIDKAKRYARLNNQSLSKLVEQYYNLIAGKDKSPEIEISPHVKEFSGIIKLSKNFNSKDGYRNHILRHSFSLISIIF